MHRALVTMKGRIVSPSKLRRKFGIKKRVTLTHKLFLVVSRTTHMKIATINRSF
jgi:bifunctional DNA-binding transcriptional regulator/antitoxin component of YhaV-PrlF toxin-antitoxin module